MADPQVKILISAVDKASGVIKGISKSTGGLNNAFKDLTGMSLGAAGGIALVGTAMQKGIKLVKDSIRETVDYNKTIREMTQVTGLGAEEISRIVQVGDDWGISIDAIRTSLAFMNKQGITPSIDKLADLADEYVNTSNKSAFAEKAVKILGRGYQTLIPILAKGGDALREQAAAIDDNLLATEESIKQSREYEVAVDELTDQWQGFKYTIGNEVIPVLSDLFTTINDNVEANEDLRDITDKLVAAEANVLITDKEVAEIRKGLRTGTLELADAQEIYKDITWELFDAATMTYPEEEKFIGIYNDLKQPTIDVTDATDDLVYSLWELRDAAGDATTMMSKYKGELIFNLVAAGLNKEQQFALADSMGLIDEQTRLAYIGVANLTEKYDLNKDGVVNAKEATDEYNTALLNLKSAIEGIPDSKDVEIRVRTIYSEDGRPPGFYEHNYQHGANFTVPPGYPNDSFPFHAESGERVIVIPKGNNTTTNNFSMSLNTNAGASTLIRDFNMMRAMAG